METQETGFEPINALAYMDLKDAQNSAIEMIEELKINPRKSFVFKRDIMAYKTPIQVCSTMTMMFLSNEGLGKTFSKFKKEMRDT